MHNDIPIWKDVHGKTVDLDKIDREYALNILMHRTIRWTERGWTAEDFREDALTQKLREVILKDHKKTLRDRVRAIKYNALCRVKGLPYRAPIR